MFFIICWRRQYITPRKHINNVPYTLISSKYAVLIESVVKSNHQSLPSVTRAKSVQLWTSSTHVPFLFACIHFQRGVVIKTSRIIHEKPHPMVECKMWLTKHQQNTSHFFPAILPMTLFDRQLYIRNITHTHSLSFSLRSILQLRQPEAGSQRERESEREREVEWERNPEESSKPIDKYTYTFLFRRNIETFSETNDSLDRER